MVEGVRAAAAPQPLDCVGAAQPPRTELRPPEPLPDYLRPGLELVLCGCNPGLFSAAMGRYYARPANAFWPLLAEAGITPRRLAPEEDATLLALGVGLTDAVARPTAGTGEVRGVEWRSGGLELVEKLRRFRPYGVAFVGDTAYRAFATGAGLPAQRARWGRQPADWEGIAVFVLPSSSGRVARLAEVRRTAFLEAGAWLQQRRAGRDARGMVSPQPQR